MTGGIPGTLQKCQIPHLQESSPVLKNATLPAPMWHVLFSFPWLWGLALRFSVFSILLRSGLIWWSGDVGQHPQLQGLNPGDVLCIFLCQSQCFHWGPTVTSFPDTSFLENSFGFSVTIFIPWQSDRNPWWEWWNKRTIPSTIFEIALSLTQRPLSLGPRWCDSTLSFVGCIF